MVEGDEGRETFLDLLASMQVPEDYEVYESTIGVMHRFPSADVGTWLFEGWWDLRGRTEFRAWDLLNLLARGEFGNEAVAAFNAVWGRAAPSRRDELRSLVEQDEQSGWLSDSPALGRLRPRN
jgi:hypothetical protein